MNCNAGPDVKICAGMDAGPTRKRPTGELIINAQGIGLSVIPKISSDAETKTEENKKDIPVVQKKAETKTNDKK